MMSELKRILVFAETANGAATAVTKELLGIGRKLTDGLGQELGAVLMGADVAKAGQELIALGADNVLQIEDSALSEPHAELFTAALVAACRETNPQLLLLGNTDLGRDMAPGAAVTLGHSLVTDCVGLDIAPDGKTLLITRPVFGGKALAEFASAQDCTQIVAVRPHSFPPAEPDTARQGKTLILPVSLDAAVAKSTLVETVREEVKGVKLQDAEVVVAGGGGIEGADGFVLLQELADVLKGAVGASREPCDSGWVPSNLKIGQTGAIVNPQMYIAVGISGAPQHVAGITGSKCIISVNNDPEAEIFKLSDFGVVADYREAMPALIQKCKELLAS